jgi:hypothetical protein
MKLHALMFKRAKYRSHVSQKFKSIESDVHNRNLFWTIGTKTNSFDPIPLEEWRNIMWVVME